MKLLYDYFDDTKKRSFKATCTLCKPELRLCKALTKQEKICGYARSGPSWSGVKYHMQVCMLLWMGMIYRHFDIVSDFTLTHNKCSLTTKLSTVFVRFLLVPCLFQCLPSSPNCHANHRDKNSTKELHNILLLTQLGALQSIVFCWLVHPLKAYILKPMQCYALRKHLRDLTHPNVLASQAQASGELGSETKNVIGR